MVQVLEDDADPTYTHFTHRQQFLDLLNELLSLDLHHDPSASEDESEEKLVSSLGQILDWYLPLPGLLDPSLAESVPPLIARLTSALQPLVEDDSLSSRHVSRLRLARLGQVLNWVIKVRGWKAVVTYFPSDLIYLTMLVKLLSPFAEASTSITPLTPHHSLISGQDVWELRTVLLLWLAVLLTMPFDLAVLSQSLSTIEGLGHDPASRLLFTTPVSSLAQKVTLISTSLLQRPGIEGSYAALVLARLYSRSDGVKGLPGFFAWAEQELQEGDRDAEGTLVASLLEFLAVIPTLITHEHLYLVEAFTADVLLPHLRGSRTAAGSGLIRKMTVKAKGRQWIARLSHSHAPGAQEDELPDGLEEQMDNLLGALSDKDTIVRYSAAKYLARLSALLPSSFSGQIVQAIIDLFSGTEDEPMIATNFGLVVDPGGSIMSEGTFGFGGSESMKGEARWHGCCLALAEMARRGLLQGDLIFQAVKWGMKGLTFDIRKASHSVGANVRDAAAYLIWSISRTGSADAIKPLASALAARLVCVACFDREVGARRAASAAFQEAVGRLGIFPEGITVLGYTDFYSISVRRMAFLVAAPAVAVLKAYRTTMIRHLHEITLRHWDVAMRILGATALKPLLQLCPATDVDASLRLEMKQLASLDADNVHGALVALTQMVPLLPESNPGLGEVISAMDAIRPAAYVSSTAASILSAACELIAVCLGPSLAEDESANNLLERLLDLTVKRREAHCHVAAGMMVGRLSELRDVSKEVSKFLKDLKGIRAAPRQAAALAFGFLNLGHTPQHVARVIGALLFQLDPTAKADVETRRNAIQSIAAICRQRDSSGLPLLDHSQFKTCVDALLNSLSDYSTDQRGDVGSWIRIAGIHALGQVISSLSEISESPLAWISQDQFENAIGEIVKQGMEKLEPVRGAVWKTFRLLRRTRANDIWVWNGSSLWKFGLEDDINEDNFRSISPVDWFESAMGFLGTEYGAKAIAGLVHSIGTQMQSMSAVALQALVKYLSPIDQRVPQCCQVFEELHGLLQANLASNRVAIPTLLTCAKLLSSVPLRSAYERGFYPRVLTDILNILSLAGRGIPTIKSIERLTATVHLIVAAIVLAQDEIRMKSLGSLRLLVEHRFPRIRSITAETLYLALSERDIDLDEELEDILLNTPWAGETFDQSVAEDVVRLLRGE